MKKLLPILILSIMCLGVSVHAQTNVSGNISVNTNWSIAGSPYVITGPLNVLENISLTIDTGVVVNVNSGNSIYVYGELVADGVKFTSSAASPAAGDWGFIQIGSSGVAASANLTDCIIEYCQKFYVYKGNVTASNTTFSQMNSAGVYVESGGFFSLKGGNINNTGYYGIYAAENAVASISGANISNANDGVLLNNNSDIVLQDLAVFGCDYPVYYSGAGLLTFNGSIDLSGNTNNYVYLGFNANSNNMSLPVANIPYYVSQTYYVQTGGTLNVNSNVLKMADNISFFVYGTLTADGATFTAFNPSPNEGAWNQFAMGTDNIAANVTLNNVLIDYARGVYVYGGTLNMQACTFNHFLDNGLVLRNGTTVNMENSTITNSNYPFYYEGSGNLILTGNNTYTGNEKDIAWVGYYSTANNWVLPSFDIPVVFGSNFQVDAGGSLTIGSGNILKFQGSTALNVYGKLLADADLNENIFFTSIFDDNWGGDSNFDGANTAPAANQWYGVCFFNSSDDASVMRLCKVRYAGSNYYGGITLTDAGPIIDSCDISNSYYGIRLNNASTPTISNTTIGSSQMTPIAMSFEANPVFVNNTLSFSDNKYDAIGLLGGTLTADATIIQRNFTGISNITYFMLDKVTVPAGVNLNISPGVVIKSDNRGYNIIVFGTLNAVGTVGNEIVFTSYADDNHGNPGDTNRDGTMATPAVGHFGTIYLADGSDASKIQHCILKYAHGYDEYINTIWRQGECAVAVIKSSPNISDNQFKDLHYGIRNYDNANPGIANNEMVNVLYTPFALTPSANPSFSGNTFNNCGWNAVGLIGGNLTTNGTIRKRDIAGYTNITYVLLHDLTIAEGTYVDVEPGIVIKMQDRTIVVNGGFKAVGNASEKIVFTSTKDDNIGNPGDTNGDGNATAPDWGNWRTIRFTETSDDAYCTLNYCDIKYGGFHEWWGLFAPIELINAAPSIQNALIDKSYVYGIEIEGNSSPVLNNVNIQNCRYDPIAMSLKSNPSFTNISFAANQSKGIRIIEGELSSDANLITRDVAGIQNIAYIVGNLTVAPSATLTIQPNVVIKMEGTITVNGALKANGSADERITFTSKSDDSVGGDTNNDGNGTVPNRGDWSGIVFNSSGLEATNSLQYCTFRYANRIIEFNSSYANVANSSIEHSNGNAIRIFGSSYPDITNNQIYNISYSPVYMSMFANPAFSGNTTANIGIMGIQISPETYSQTDTVPIRDFAGNNNITYYMSGTYTINSGTTITIPAGVVFKSLHDFSWWDKGDAQILVNGALNIEGTVEAPVIFTSFYDDSVGSPADMGNDGNATSGHRGSGAWIKFNDISDDVSTISHTEFRYKPIGIELMSAAPIISNNYFTKLDAGVSMSGVSEPQIINNTFHDLLGAPINISLVAYPANTDGNIISGTTFRVIRVNDETLTQDVTLVKRDFGGITNIPYLFNNYAIGTSAVLTINEGIVCKFYASGVMNVYKGLQVNGGILPKDRVVFTSLFDDFYGGDSNSDGNATRMYNDGNRFWSGINIQNEAIDANCNINNAIIRYAGWGIDRGGMNLYSASPSFSNVSFMKSGNGILAFAASNPVIQDCDFSEITEYGVRNVDLTFNINATDCWWGSNNGPTHSGNAGGNGAKVTDNVVYTPFGNTGMINPETGDVSLNGKIQAYDAALILQHAVGAVTLNADQLAVGDVSANGGADPVTAYDASLILQYNVGMIDWFQMELSKKAFTNAFLEIGEYNVKPGDVFTVSVNINSSELKALQAALTFDSEYLTVKELAFGSVLDGMTTAHFWQEGKVQFAAAAPVLTFAEGTLVYITFEVRSDITNPVNVPIGVNKLMVNEMNANVGNNGGMVHIVPASATYIAKNANDDFAMLIYPNPVSDELHIRLNSEFAENISIDVLAITGQQIANLDKMQLTHGEHTLSYSLAQIPAGFYFVKVSSGSKLSVRKIHIVK